MAHVPLVLIHGFPFDHRMWLPVMRGLRQRAFATDLPGVGSAVGPESPDDYSIAVYAASQIRLLDSAMFTQAVFCGFSMGGYIVFDLLRRFPERVRAAILCNTKASADTPEAKRSRDTMAVRARMEGMTAVADETVNRLLARGTREQRPDVVRDVIAMIASQPVGGIVGALHALRERPDSTPLLGQIQVPVLVLAGEDDQITPAEGMRDMARSIPSAQFVLIADAGHLTPVEQPQAVSDAINAFLMQLT